MTRRPSSAIAPADRLGTTIVADWTRPETQRAFAIQEAESDRAAAILAIMAEISAAYERFPDAPSVGEACALAGLDVDAINARLAAIPPPDDLGLQWLIGELERAERRGVSSSFRCRDLDGRSHAPGAHCRGLDDRATRARPRMARLGVRSRNSPITIGIAATSPVTSGRVLLRCRHLHRRRAAPVLAAFRAPDALFSDADLGRSVSLDAAQTRLLVPHLDGPDAER